MTMDGSTPDTSTIIPGLTATYSPDDNKIRLSAVHKLDAETYAKVKAAGFSWAPKQQIFVAPMWTPEREDLATELAGEIEDEDRSLVDRAEERAERFEDYSEKRANEAERAHDAVAALADAIPLGQPILVGHHSEKRARRDAQKIENGMRRALKLWSTAEYWERRAKGAIRAAKYKERPDVRYRRIKTLEADKRSYLKQIDECEHYSKLWEKPDVDMKRATQIANYDHHTLPPTEGQPYGDTLWSALDKGQITAADAAAYALKRHAQRIAYARRWIAHLDLRLGYEHAMLDNSGGLTAKREGFKLEVGGHVETARRYNSGIILRVTKKGDEVLSVTVAGQYGCKAKVGIEEIRDYTPPTAEETEKVKAATKLATLVNYQGEGFHVMTEAEWKKVVLRQAGAIRRADATETHGPMRYRHAYLGGSEFDGGKSAQVFVSDLKIVERPKKVVK